MEAEGHSLDFARGSAGSSCSAAERRLQHQAGFLPAGPRATGCKQLLKMQWCSRSSCGGFHPGLHRSCLPRPCRDSSPGLPFMPLCQHRAPNWDVLRSFSTAKASSLLPEPCSLEQCLFSLGMPPNEGHRPLPQHPEGHLLSHHLSTLRPGAREGCSRALPGVWGREEQPPPAGGLSAPGPGSGFDRCLQARPAPLP